MGKNPIRIDASAPVEFEAEKSGSCESKDFEVRGVWAIVGLGVLFVGIHPLQFLELGNKFARGTMG
jgi:hypothetical protein